MKRHYLALAALIVLSACAGVKAVSGNYPVGADYTVALGQTWADVSPLAIGRTKAVHFLTVDGPLLNRLYVTEGLAPGGYMLKPLNKETPTPTYRAGLAPGELAEFVTDTVGAMGFQAPEHANLRPAKFGVADGVRFDIATRTKEGLIISGTSLVAERNGKLYVMLYLAPSEHYYAAHLAEIEATFASASLR